MPGLNDIVGQIALKDLIRPKIQLAKSGGLTIPHLLLCGDKECGKMTFATAMADELGVPLSSTSGQTLVKFLDLSGELTNLGRKGVLVIRDVEAIRPAVVLELFR